MVSRIRGNSPGMVYGRLAPGDHASLMRGFSLNQHGARFVISDAPRCGVSPGSDSRLSHSLPLPLRKGGDSPHCGFPCSQPLIQGIRRSCAALVLRSKDIQLRIRGDLPDTEVCCQARLPVPPHTRRFAVNSKRPTRVRTGTSAYAEIRPDADHQLELGSTFSQSMGSHPNSSIFAAITS